ncbi:hypothetical protein G9A89_015404 [Geosiphon pyriformis]|nr:hypothetical protein G9A89_015404 [Geosiphon pyriformis]
MQEQAISTTEDTLPKFTSEEIASLVSEANEHKTEGNKFFTKSEYPDAIQQYHKALDACPEECTEERAVYWGNIGACEIKLENYKQAVDACTKALNASPKYTKVLLRRAQANEKIGSYAALISAQEDYKELLESPDHQEKLTPVNCKNIRNSLTRLPRQISEAQEHEKNEMLGKLKDLGNTILGKFGLSTDNFNMVKNDETGGYNVQFNNNNPGGRSTNSEGAAGASGSKV